MSLESSQDVTVSHRTNCSEKCVEIAVLRAVTSMQSASEWGMRAFHSSFPCLKDRFVYEERVDICSVIKMCVLLLDFQANKVVINEIRNHYKTHLNQDDNVCMHQQYGNNHV